MLLARCATMSCSRFLYACAVTAGCVVGAIDKQMAVLVPNAPNEERVKALKYLVHFVADVHQPLRAGVCERHRRQLPPMQAYGSGTNLHLL